MAGEGEGILRMAKNLGEENGADCECLCKVGDIWEAIKESWEQEYSVPSLHLTTHTAPCVHPCPSPPPPRASVANAPNGQRHVRDRGVLMLPPTHAPLAADTIYGQTPIGAFCRELAFCHFPRFLSAGSI